MSKRLSIKIIFIFLLLQFYPSSKPIAEAQAPESVRFSSAYELIDAVNGYRNQHGLPAYTVNSILMSTAQSQAEYMASTGTVTHIGPGGISFPDRLIAAGYSFVFRSENIISASPDATGWSLVTSPAWADDLHQHTMLSPDLKEIGAGMAVSGGRGYYVIDCGGSGGGGSSASYTAAPGSTPIISNGTSATPVVVIPNTPKPDGSISHIVQPGETLWSIAIAYETTINGLKNVNRLTSDDIYPGNTLIILLPKDTPTPPPTSTITPYPSPSPFIFRTVTSSPAPTASAMPSSPVPGINGVVIAGVIISLAMIAAGAVTAAGAGKKRKS